MAALLNRLLAKLIIQNADISQQNFLGCLLQPSPLELFNPDKEIGPLLSGHAEFSRALRLFRGSAEQLERLGDNMEAAEGFYLCGVGHRRFGQKLLRRGHEFVYSSNISVRPAEFRASIANLNSVALSHIRTAVTAV